MINISFPDGAIRQFEKGASDDFAVGMQIGYRYGLHYLRWLKEAQGR